MRKDEKPASPETEEMEIAAVDAVILPPREITEAAITLSRMLGESPVVLGETDFRPHITIAMGYVRNSDKAVEAVKDISAQMKPITLTIEDLVRGEQDFNGHYFYYLVVGNNLALQALHLKIMHALDFVDVRDGPVGAFAGEQGEEINKTTRKFVSLYRSQASHDKFWPHITLGAGPEGILTPEISPVQLPATFEADTIALAQLGNFCTVRKLLTENY